MASSVCNNILYMWNIGFPLGKPIKVVYPLSRAYLGVFELLRCTLLLFCSNACPGSRLRTLPTLVNLLQAKPDALAGDVTEAEIAAFMRAAGPIPSSQLTSHFKKRVLTMEQRKTFTAKVKRLAKLQEVEPGRKCIVLR